MFITPPTPKTVSNDLEQSLRFAQVRRWWSSIQKIRERVGWQQLGWGLLVVIGLGSVGTSLWWLLSSGSRFNGEDQHLVQIGQSPVTASTHSASVSTNTSSSAAGFSQDTRLAQAKTIQVDAAGVVTNPGLYALPPGSRVAALIEQAGGFATNADTQFISQELNLAKELQDGEKVYIFTKQEASQRRLQLAQTAIAGLPVNTSSTQTTTGTSAQALISLNTASQSQLESLAGIGEKRATDIIAARPFASVDELVTKKLVSEAVFADIKAQLTL